MMKGWKTWLAVAGLLALAVVDFYNDDLEAALTKVTAALAAIGIGHKIEKVIP